MDESDTNKVSKIILIRNHRILLLFSNKLQKFQFPGGHLEVGETHLDALKRELKEETNLNLKDSRVFFKKPNYVLYYGHAFQGPVKISEEHTKYVWASYDDILKYPLCKFTFRDANTFIKYKFPNKNKKKEQDDLEDESEMG